MMSYGVFAFLLVAVIVVGWIGFLIIAVALVRDSAEAVRNRGGRPSVPADGEEAS